MSQVLTQLSVYNVTQKLMINVMNKLVCKLYNKNKTHAIGASNFCPFKSTPSVMHTFTGTLHSIWLMKFIK